MRLGGRASRVLLVPVVVASALAMVGAPVAADRGDEPISVSSSGAQGSGPSTEVAISGEGRYVAFTSAAPDLVAGTTVGADVFVRDRVLGVTELVSVGSSPGNAPSRGPSISTDGRLVAFVSEADNLVAGDSNGRPDVFAKDLQTGSVRRVSLREDGSQIPQGATEAVLSGDGQVVVFRTAAKLRGADSDPGEDLYRRHLGTGAVELVSHPDAHGDGTGGVEPAVSADGRIVAYVSWFAGTTPSIYVRDTVGDTTRELVFSHFGDADDGSVAPAVSGDGRIVAFITDGWGTAVDPVEDDDLYVWNRVTGRYTRITRSLPIHTHFEASLSVSGDGRVLVFSGSGGGEESLMWVHDQRTGVTAPVTTNQTGSGDFDGASLLLSAVTEVGDRFAFISDRPEVAGDTNGVADVYLRSVPRCTITGTSGPDILEGTAGRDVVCGMAGDDLLIGGRGADILAGSAGVDTISYANAARGVAVDLGQGTARGQGRDVVSTVEDVIGSRYADLLTGGATRNLLRGLRGRDTVLGGYRSDVLHGGSGRDDLDGGEDLLGGDSDACHGGRGSDVATQCETLTRVP